MSKLDSSFDSIAATTRRLFGWSKGLAPYVIKTVTLQRPVQNARLRRRTRCAGIDEYYALGVNGHDQWLRIRGESANNPVLLYLHGGPGGSQLPSYRCYQLGWEPHFTIVHWEQRGTGKSYSRYLDRSTMTLPQLISDGLFVIDHIAQRFGQRPILLLGHSWGSLLAAHILHRRPSMVAAYVGVGQIANQIASEQRMHEFALGKAVAEDNRRAIDQLNIEGYPSNGHLLPGQIARVRFWARHYGYLGSGTADVAKTYTRLMSTPEYGLNDIYRFLKGTLVSTATLGRCLFADEAAQPVNLRSRLSVPVFLISGRRDHFTPATMAADYLASVSAPEKQHVVVADSGHYPHEDDPTEFLATLRRLVQPYLS
jgi:pimeloyl-ACP methyl ester carboxylesterase